LAFELLQAAPELAVLGQGLFHEDGRCVDAFGFATTGVFEDAVFQAFVLGGHLLHLFF
jgi:hypothetical protein